jgi:P22 coat protein - gene protein 5
MANQLQEVTPKLLASGLLALREQAIMPRLVNREYEEQAGQIGSTVDVPIPSAITVQSVTPGPTPPATADVSPTSVPIPLDQWFEAPFFMTDKDILTAMNGFLPMQASEAIKSIANQVDSYILNLYKGVYGFVGTPGSAPFGSGIGTQSATQSRRVLNRQLAPLGDRRIVIDPDAEANALELPAFQYVQNAGDNQVMREANLGRRLGFDFFVDQNVMTHVAGSAAGFLVNQSNHAVGSKTVTVDTGTGAWNVGDIFTVAGDVQTYVIKSSTATVLTYEPAAKTAFADNAAITKKPSHVVNLAFHRDAFAFATRPLATQNKTQLGVITQAAVDPISGLALRLEITHEHKRVRFSYDLLYGGALIRPELVNRISG